jgi:hypothetical protein
MKLEDQACSLDLAKRLKELGVRQESIFYWVHPSEYWGKGKKEELFMAGTVLKTSNLVVGKDVGVSAFTVAELGEMLPKGTWMQVFNHSEEWQIALDRSPIKSVVGAKTETDARAMMLIYLTEKGEPSPTPEA